MSLYSNNDWRDYLQHNWGNSPKMKKAEKEYNAKYYQEHKDEILKNRREKNASREEFDDQSDYKFRGREINSEDDLHKRASEEEDEAARLIEENEKIGGYSEEVMKNIREHNEQVKKNIEELTSTVNDYINNHPELSDEQRKSLTDSLTKQIDRAHTQMIDLSQKSGRDYVDGLLKGNKSSGTSSSSKSTSTKKKSSKTTQTQTKNTKSTTKNKTESPIDRQLREKEQMEKKITNVADLKKLDYQQQEEKKKNKK